jgi:putative flippase GtrA
MRRKILSVIDIFYPLVKKYMPLQTFRYAVCGGSNMLLDIAVYFISYNYILHKQILNLGFIAFQPYTAALWIAFCISFPTGFILSKYIVFNSSQLRGRIQLFRYILIVAVNLLLNYSIIKILVEFMHFYPTIARFFATCFVVTFSYLSQKHFTFKTANTIGGSDEVKSQ